MDLDLHLSILEGNGERRVFFGERGSLEAAPWATLDGDTRRAGSEEMSLERYYDATYRCFVHFYSGRPLGITGAVVQVLFEGSILTIPCPVGAEKPWWHVFDWNTRTNQLRIVNLIGADRPSPRS